MADGRGRLGPAHSAAARLARDCIKKVEAPERTELGIDAVWKIEVEDFLAFAV